MANSPARPFALPLSDSPHPLLDIAEAKETRLLFKKYRDTFALDPKGPYAVQWPGKDWTTKYKPVSDPLIQAHLDGKYWLAVRGPYYPRFLVLDFDRPKPGQVEGALEKLGATPDNVLIFTSPSHGDTGNVHVFVLLTYKDRVPTLNLGREALLNVVGKDCEVYPQARRKFRCPLGREQWLLDEHNQPMAWIDWRQSMTWFETLEPIPIENLPFQPPLPFKSEARTEDKPRRWVANAEAELLWKEGLQATGTRHGACWTVAVWLWRNNFAPKEAEQKIGAWLKARHNGYSKTINAGDWREAEGDIRRQVQWIWANFRTYPDRVHNADAAVTAADLRFACGVFPGDVVSQKRLVNLIAYYRPRRRWEWVYIPAWVWAGIGDRNDYINFRERLESLGRLESIHSYRHVAGRPDLSYSKRFRLHLPETHDAPLENDDRHVVEYWEVVKAATGSVRDAVALTGGHKFTVYRGFEGVLGDKSFGINEVTFQ